MEVPRELSQGGVVWFGLLGHGGSGLVYWGLTPQQQPGSYQGGEMMMKSVFWWRKPEYPEEWGSGPMVGVGGGPLCWLMCS